MLLFVTNATNVTINTIVTMSNYEHKESYRMNLPPAMFFILHVGAGGSDVVAFMNLSKMASRYNLQQQTAMLTGVVAGVKERILPIIQTQANMLIAVFLVAHIKNGTGYPLAVPDEDEVVLMGGALINR